MTERVFCSTIENMVENQKYGRDTMSDWKERFRKDAPHINKVKAEEKQKDLEEKKEESKKEFISIFEEVVSELQSAANISIDKYHGMYKDQYQYSYADTTFVIKIEEYDPFNGQFGKRTNDLKARFVGAFINKNSLHKDFTSEATINLETDSGWLTKDQKEPFEKKHAEAIFQEAFHKYIVQE